MKYKKISASLLMAACALISGCNDTEPTSAKNTSFNVLVLEKDRTNFFYLERSDANDLVKPIFSRNPPFKGLSTDVKCQKVDVAQIVDEVQTASAQSYFASDSILTAIIKIDPLSESKGNFTIYSNSEETCTSNLNEIKSIGALIIVKPRKSKNGVKSENSQALHSSSHSVPEKTSSLSGTKKIKGVEDLTMRLVQLSELKMDQPDVVCMNETCVANLSEHLRFRNQRICLGREQAGTFLNDTLNSLTCDIDAQAASSISSSLEQAFGSADESTKKVYDLKTDSYTWLDRQIGLHHWTGYSRNGQSIEKWSISFDPK